MPEGTVDDVVVVGQRPERPLTPYDPGGGTMPAPTLPADHPERDPSTGGQAPSGFFVSTEMKAVEQSVSLMITVAEALAALPVISPQDAHALEIYIDLLEALNDSIASGAVVSQATAQAALTVAFEQLIGLGTDRLAAAAVSMVGAAVGSVVDGPLPFGEAVGAIAGYAAGLVISSQIPDELPGMLANAVLGGAEGRAYVNGIIDRFNVSLEGRGFFTDLLIWNIFGGDPDGVGGGFKMPDLFGTQDEQPTYNGEISAYNYIVGTAASQNMAGSALGDIINPGRGRDVINGGAGNDTLDYKMPAVAMNVNLATGQSYQYRIESEVDTLTSIENVIGSAQNDQIVGNSVANILIGRKGNDLLNGAEGDDELHGGEGNDQLVGGSGNDTAVYQDEIGALSINLQTGSATVGSFTDTLNSIENVIGTAFADHIVGDSNANILAGNLGNDTIYGGGGNDTIYGGDGDDFLFGGDGDDRFSVDRGNDVIDGEAGFDSVHFRGNRSDYSISAVDGGWLVAWGMEEVTIYNVEQATFADVSLSTNNPDWYL